jgi:hypothetical protein
MSLWHTAPATGSDVKARTYVFISGSSSYANLPKATGAPIWVSNENPFGLSQVDSPATSAFELAKWFRDYYHNPTAPLDKIWLLVSPSEFEGTRDAELKALGELPELRATSRNAEADLTAWWTACNGNPNHFAILYGAGHGVSESGTAFVLLEDFMLDPRRQFLSASLDIGSISTNMVGPNTASTQLYFSDACRLPADAKWRGLGYGLTVGGQTTGADRRSVALCYSAAPGESAKAFAGRPTLFGEALLACLKGAAWSAPDSREPTWHISIDSLIFNLKTRLDALASIHQTEQSMQPNSQGKNATVHVPDPQPTVDLTINVTPQPDFTRTYIDVWRGDGYQIATPRPVPAIPLVLSNLQPAIYSVVFDFVPPEPPFSKSERRSISANPPVASCDIEL